ncbi:N-acetylmuramoyl-L-alanine amidase [Mycobacterium sp. MHSD3]|nr:N-acetylmuramoyl-L-alanine amidase [Mycobacterium sp. MHSD3]
MSFTEFLQDDPLLTREQVMSMLIRVADELNMPDKRGACVIAGMTVSQEAGVEDNDPPYERRFWCPANHADPESFNYAHDSVSNDGRSVGYFQQQKGPAGELWWGTTASEMDLHSATTEFMSRLKAMGYDASNAQTANDSAQAVQRSGVPQAYKQWWTDINALYDKVTAGGVPPAGPSANPNLTPTPGFRGDPVWLADVLRAEQLNVIEMPGWQDRGEGDQGVLWGVVFHHTGNANETPEGIAFHPTLGLAAQLLIRPNGDVWVCGIGKANHAGVGSWPGIVTDNANPVTIGIEVAILPREGAPHREGWPDVQYDATVKAHAAILRKLAQRSNRVISHKEWAQLGPAGWRQGKWDPGAIDMNIFRADVEARITGFNPQGQSSGEDDFMSALTPDEQREMLALLRWMAAPGTGEFRKRFPSRSPLRHLDEGDVDTAVGIGLNDDGNDHVVLVKELAEVGHPGSLALLHELANADPAKYPDRVEGIDIAKRILAGLTPAEPSTAPAPTVPAEPAAPATVCALSNGQCPVAGATADGGCPLAADGRCVIATATGTEAA